MVENDKIVGNTGTRSPERIHSPESPAEHSGQKV